MKFFIATAAVVGLASAATVSDATLRDNNGLQSVELSIDGTKCSADSPAALGARQIACPGSAFSWHVTGSASDYEVTLFKGVNTDAPQASAKLPVNCRAGGAGADDQVCTQTGDATVDI
ncbi:hypothetical protein SLS55_010576 [Diplodia seriata]|uniref:AA1-like domain-containing protein n=1 Tax=Diplodia seriata TaxID=420778 RepID=A0A0G2EBU2_9PEZI|nr:hypothetical protein UCDDS831_g05190 [Diplodia seriata]